MEDDVRQEFIYVDSRMNALLTMLEALRDEVESNGRTIRSIGSLLCNMHDHYNKALTNDVDGLRDLLKKNPW